MYNVTGCLVEVEGNLSRQISDVMEMTRTAVRFNEIAREVNDTYLSELRQAMDSGDNSVCLH